MIHIDIDKGDVFSYVQLELLKWYSDKNEIANNDLSKMKSIKLLFFVCACSDDMCLFDIFDEFHAWKNGPVEETVYGLINGNKLNYIKIDTSHTEVLNSQTPNIPQNSKKIVDSSIVKLKERNYDMVSMRVFDIVEISKRWISWQIAFNSEMDNRKISIDNLRKDRQLFHLRPF